MEEVRIGRCSRCNRALKDPRSIDRGMGPVCWAESSGDVFEKDLEASDAEWERRGKTLVMGGEIDLGANWQHIDYDPNMALQIPQTMRVSLRFNKEAGVFEAYGEVAGLGHKEIVFGQSQDIRTAYAIAVKAGPESTATVYRISKSRRRASRRAA